MDIESSSQIVSLDTAIRLHKAGWRGQAHYYYVTDGEYTRVAGWDGFSKSEFKDPSKIKFYSAPTLRELGSSVCEEVADRIIRNLEREKTNERL